jgi:hypothetical protein
VVTLVTVPVDPPEAAPERALDPPPAAGPPAAGAAAVVEGDAAVGAGDAAVDDGDVLQPATSAITAHVIAATTHPRRLFDGDRPTLGCRARLAKVAETDESGEDAGGGGGAVKAPPELSPAGGPDIVLDTGRAGLASWGFVGSYSFMVLLLLDNYTEIANR